MILGNAQNFLRDEHDSFQFSSITVVPISIYTIDLEQI